MRSDVLQVANPATLPLAMQLARLYEAKLLALKKGYKSQVYQNRVIPSLSAPVIPNQEGEKRAMNHWQHTTTYRQTKNLHHFPNRT